MSSIFTIERDYYKITKKDGEVFYQWCNEEEVEVYLSFGYKVEKV